MSQYLLSACFLSIFDILQCCFNIFNKKLFYNAQHAVKCDMPWHAECTWSIEYGLATTQAQIIQELRLGLKGGRRRPYQRAAGVFWLVARMAGEACRSAQISVFGWDIWWAAAMATLEAWDCTHTYTLTLERNLSMDIPWLAMRSSF